MTLPPVMQSAAKHLGMTGMVVFLLSTAPALAQQPPIVCPDIAAAEKGAVIDEYFLGKAYDEGYCGIAADKEEAEHWYRRAAEQGHMLAQYELAETYFTGDGFATDYPESKKWYRKAAEQGHGPSQLRMAFLSAEAHFKGVTVDMAEAEQWFMKAAEQNAGDAQFRLGNFYLHYKQPPDPAKALIWLKRAAEGGHRVAMFDLGRLLLSGRGIPRNEKLGMEWLTKSAESDILQAQMTLVEIYTSEKTKNVREALKWILKICAKPTASPIYLNKAGDIFFDGWETVPKNYPAARKYYERSAAREDPHALERLARMYEEGLGVEKDAAKAQEYRSKIKAE